MTRLLAAVMLLAATAMPAFACGWMNSAANATKSQTAAAQPADDSTPPPPPAQHTPG